jgi:pimeloyl-ACP methyl ester carboxylesterase
MSEPPGLTGVTHEYLDAGGLRTHVALAGSPQAPAVLLVHGWPQHWWCWREVIPSLAERFRVIAPDLRGHGWTEAPRHGYEKEQLVSDLLALLDALGIERMTWIGHDWGGIVGFMAALRAPERFERMLTLGIPHLWVKRDPRVLPVFLAYQGPISLPILGPRLADAMVRRVLQVGRGPDRLSQDDVELFANNIPPHVTTAMYRTWLTREFPATLGGRYARQVLRVPTTLMVGSRDAVSASAKPGPVPRQPELEVEVLEGVGHWLPEQRPQRIIDWALSGARRETA